MTDTTESTDARTIERTLTVIRVEATERLRLSASTEVIVSRWAITAQGGRCNLEWEASEPITPGSIVTVTITEDQ